MGIAFVASPTLLYSARRQISLKHKTKTIYSYTDTIPYEFNQDSRQRLSAWRVRPL